MFAVMPVIFIAFESEYKFLSTHVLYIMDIFIKKKFQINKFILFKEFHVFQQYFSFSFNLICLFSGF